MRRTDKIGTEASFHDLDEYMKHVDYFFDIYELMNPEKKFKRTVYLASDEVSVMKDSSK